MILIVEPDISRVRFKAFGRTGTRTLEWHPPAGESEDNQAQDLSRALTTLKGSETIRAVSLRLQFGPPQCPSPLLISAPFADELMKLADQFPLYIPTAANIIRLLSRLCGTVPLRAFFETSLFTALPEEERQFPVASEYVNGLGIARRGYHGIFHGAHASLFPGSKKIISVVMDRHTTVCAIENGVPLSVSLGSSPHEGIMSAKSCGDIDPGIIIYLMKEQGFSMYRIDEILKCESGFLGLTGYRLALSEMISLYGRDAKVTRAFNIYLNQMLKHIGDCIGIMHGFDTIICGGRYVTPFGRIIFELAKTMSCMGISLAELPWDTQQGLVRISSDDSTRHFYISTLLEADIIYHETVQRDKDQ